MRFMRLSTGVLILAATLWAAPAEERAGDREAIRAHVNKIGISEYGNSVLRQHGDPVFDVRYEVDSNGQRSARSGRVTEIFVYRKGQWVNPGWPMDSGS